MRKPPNSVFIEPNKSQIALDTPKPFLSKSSKSTPCYQKKIECVCFRENGGKCVDPGCILFSSSASHSSSSLSIAECLSPKPNKSHLKSTLSCDSCTSFKSECPFESVHSDTDQNISNEILPDFSPCTSKLSLSTEAKKRKHYLSTHSRVNATAKDSTKMTALFSPSFPEKLDFKTMLTRLFPSMLIKVFLSLLLFPYRFYQCLCCQKATSRQDIKSLSLGHKENDSFSKKCCLQELTCLCEKCKAFEICSLSFFLVTCLLRHCLSFCLCSHKANTPCESPRFHYLGSFPFHQSTHPPHLTCDLTVTPTLKYSIPFCKWLRMMLAGTTRASATSVLTCFFSCCSCICLILFFFLDSSPMLDQYVS